jgi:hypothetical protein
VCRDGEKGGDAEAGAPGASTSNAGRSSKMGNAAGSGGSKSDAGAGGTSGGDKEHTSSSGGTSTTSNSDPREYGEGDYGITLSEPESDIYCWIIQKNTAVCNGTLTTDYEDLCVAREKDCSSRVPNNTSEDKGDCYFSSTYQLVSGGPLTGTCEKLDAYWDDDPNVECLFHSHCGPEGRCIDYECFCPEGAHCDPEPPPPPPGGNPGGSGGAGAGPSSSGGGGGGAGADNGGPGSGGTPSGGAGPSGPGGTGALPPGGTSSGGNGPMPPDPPPPMPPDPPPPAPPPAPPSSPASR